MGHANPIFRVMSSHKFQSSIFKIRNMIYDPNFGRRV